MEISIRPSSIDVSPSRVAGHAASLSISAGLRAFSYAFLQGRPGLVDAWGWLIYLIYQNIMELIVLWLHPLINEVFKHNCRKFGGERKRRERVITVCCFL